MTLKDLILEIETRQEMAPQIRKAVDEYCCTYYGIADFQAGLNQTFVNQQSFAVCLARQVPTASIEHLAQVMFAAWLSERGLKTAPLSLSLTSDSFSYKSPTKSAYVKVPFLGRGRKGLFWANERIVAKEEARELDGRILAGIKTVTGELLPEYHSRLREEVLGDVGQIIDFSPIFVRFVTKAIENRRITPSSVYIEEGNYEKKVDLSSLGVEPLVRPPADWYYFLALLMYLDGKRALLFTIRDDEEFTSLVKGTKERIQQITGFSPLILDIPDLVQVGDYISHHSLVEIPRWVFADPEWQKRFAPPNSNDISLFEVYEHFEKQFIELA